MGGLSNDGGDHSHFRKHIVISYEFSSTCLNYCHPESCSTADLVEFNCSTEPNSKCLFRTRVSALPLAKVRHGRSTSCELDLRSWIKLLRKFDTLGAFFLNIVADRFFPAPGSSVVGCSKESRIPKRL